MRKTEGGCKLRGGKSEGQFGRVASKMSKGHPTGGATQVVEELWEVSELSRKVQTPIYSATHSGQASIAFLPHKYSWKDPITHYDLLVARSNG